MRLTRLGLRSYGCFEALDLPLDAQPGRLNLLLAPNGAGKSVLRQAFADLLFEVPVRSGMTFRFHARDLRLSAHAVGTDGEELAFARRKGQGATLIDKQGEELAPERLGRLLGSATRDVLERLFALDTAALRRGAAELTNENGQLGPALLSAAGGLASARTILNDLAAARDEKAPKRRAAQRPYYLALDRFNKAQAALKAAMLRPETWSGEAARIAEAREAEQAASAAAEAARLRENRLRRVHATLSPLAARAEATAWLEVHADAPLLPSNLAERLALVRGEVAQTGAVAERANAQLRQRETELQKAPAGDAALLAEADAIDALEAERAVVLKAARDLPGVEAERTGFAAEIRRLRAEFGASEGEAVPIPPEPTRRAAEAVIARLTKLDAEAQVARQRMIQASTAERVAATDLAACAAISDTGPLSRLLREIRTDGDPRTRAAKVSTAVRDADAAVLAGMARVPGWKHGAEALIGLAVAPLPTYERCYEVLESRDRAAEAARDGRRRAAAVLERKRTDLAALASSGSLPDPAALQAARAHRDAGWHLIFRSAFTPAPPDAAEVIAWSGGTPLPLAYVDAVAAADDVADRRVEDAERVARAAQLANDIAAAEVALVAAATEADAAWRSFVEANTEWESLCAPLHLESPRLPDVRAFMAARDAAIVAVAQASRASDEARELGEQHAAWATRLRTLLPQAPADAELPALLLVADAELADAEETRDRRTRAEAALAERRTALRDAKHGLQSAEAALDELRGQWQGTLRKLGRPEDELPEATAAALRLIEELRSALAGEADRAARIAGMLQDHARFAAGVEALARRVAPDLVGQSPDETARVLKGRLEAARRAQEQADESQRRLLEAETEAAGAGERLDRAKARLRGVVAEAGASDVEAAEARITLARERAVHARARETAEAELIRLGEGRSVETLASEAEGVDPDRIAGDLAAAQTMLANALAAWRTATEQRARLEHDLGQRLAAEDATTAAADAAAAAGEAGRVLEEAVVLHLAHELLAAGLSALEAEGKGEVVARISARVAALAPDAGYDVTVADGKAGAPTLFFRQPGTRDEPKTMDQLSEGTRDQVFLALRLIAIEDYARTAPALPFLADDILQTFDDARALATLHALLDFSATAQVIVLTHHRHVAELAEQLPRGSVNLRSITA